MNRVKKSKPAIVKFIGNAEDYNNKVTKGKEYYAFFVEYWQGERCNLHIRDNSGKIEYWYDLKEFEIVNDVDNVLNFKDATVRCIRESQLNGVVDLKEGKDYIAIGIGGERTMSGMYLVLDESYDNYFYPPNLFEIIRDPEGILDSNTGCIVYDFDNTFEL